MSATKLLLSVWESEGKKFSFKMDSGKFMTSEVTIPGKLLHYLSLIDRCAGERPVAFLIFHKLACNLAGNIIDKCMED